LYKEIATIIVFILLLSNASVFVPIARSDEAPAVEWSKTYGGSPGPTRGDDGAVQIIQTREGDYAVFGGTWSFATRECDWWLVKIDVDGNQQWNKTYDGRGWDNPRAVVQTSDEGYALFGDTAYGELGPDVDFWLVRTDENGNQLWNRTYGGTGDEWGAFNLVWKNNEGYAFAGRTNSFGAGGNDLWLVKTDLAGNMEWTETYGGGADDVCTSIVQTKDGGYALVGYTNSFSGDGNYEVWLIKLVGIGPRTWTVDDDGPADFSTIQDAIDNASAGDTVFVRNGAYYEHVVVNKTLTLVGESKDSTIIDGSNNGYVVDVLADNVSISQFTLQNAGSSWSGVNVESSGTVIRDNLMIDNRGGVWVRPGSLNTTISGNNIFNKQPSYADGIRLWSSGTLVTGNIVMNESTGIGLDWTSDNIVRNNTVVTNYIGIGASNAAYDNVFSENTIANSSYGFLTVIYSSKFFHNNIMDNSVQVAFYGSGHANVWDDGYPSGGNYWSNYNGIDSGGDGLGDEPYVIDASNQDNYPLMSPWTPPDIAVRNLTTSRTVVGEGFSSSVNVTVENQGNKIEAFNVSVYANATLIESQKILLAGGNSAVLTFDWNTTGLARGNYTMTAYAIPLSEEIDTADNNCTIGNLRVCIPGNLNGDSAVDSTDLVILGESWGTFVGDPNYIPEADINSDGVVDSTDLGIMGVHWGETE